MPLGVVVVSISYNSILLAFRSQDSPQRLKFLKCHADFADFADFSKCHADFSKCHAMADDATSWNSIYYSDRSNLA